jgi:hypothetical protein
MVKKAPAPVFRWASIMSHTFGRQFPVVPNTLEQVRPLTQHLFHECLGFCVSHSVEYAALDRFLFSHGGHDNTVPTSSREVAEFKKNAARRVAMRQPL